MGEEEAMTLSKKAQQERNSELQIAARAEYDRLQDLESMAIMQLATIQADVALAEYALEKLGVKP